jgi:hypothetical protein
MNELLAPSKSSALPCLQNDVHFNGGNLKLVHVTCHFFGSDLTQPRVRFEHTAVINISECYSFMIHLTTRVQVAQTIWTKRGQETVHKAKLHNLYSSPNTLILCRIY